METYVILANFIDPGKMDAEQAGAMMSRVQATAKSLSISVSSWLITMGHYDSVLIIQSPNAGIAAKFAMLLASNGLRTQTLRAFSPEEAAGLLA